jgi:hypothetical protein
MYAYLCGFIRIYNTVHVCLQNDDNELILNF